MIDFDNVHPGDRLEDVGYALRAHLNLGLVDLTAAAQGRRVAAFLDADGTDADPRALLARTYDAAEERCGANGSLDELAGLEAERAWIAASRL